MSGPETTREWRVVGTVAFVNGTMQELVVSTGTEADMRNRAKNPTWDVVNVRLEFRTVTAWEPTE